MENIRGEKLGGTRKLFSKIAYIHLNKNTLMNDRECMQYEYKGTLNLIAHDKKFLI